MKKKVYFCTIDWRHEVGSIWANAYASISELKKHHSCWENCGITEVDLTNAPAKEISPSLPWKDAVPFDVADLQRLTELEAEITQLNEIQLPLGRTPLGKRLAALQFEKDHLQKHIASHRDANRK